MTELTQPIATILAALIAAFLGSWFGSMQALSKMRRERAFDRQLDWYERFIRSLHDLSQKIEVAITFQTDPSSPSDHLAHLWREVQSAHLSLDRLAMEALLYGNAASVQRAKSLQSLAQAVANQSEGFDPLAIPNEARDIALKVIAALPHQLYEGSQPLLETAREHLGIQ